MPVRTAGQLAEQNQAVLPGATTATSPVDSEIAEPGITQPMSLTRADEAAIEPGRTGSIPRRAEAPVEKRGARQIRSAERPAAARISVLSQEVELEPISSVLRPAELTEDPPPPSVSAAPEPTPAPPEVEVELAGFELRKSLDPVAATSAVALQKPLPGFVPAETVAIGLRPVREPTSGQGCECPYDRNAEGEMCEGESEWSKPGGYDPVCYADNWAGMVLPECPLSETKSSEGAIVTEFCLPPA